MGAGSSQPALARRHTFSGVGPEIEMTLSQDMTTYPLRKYTSFQPASSYLYETSSDSGHLVGSTLAPVGEEALARASPQYGSSSFAATLARAQMDRSTVREALAKVSDVPGAGQLDYLQRNSTGQPDTSETRKSSTRRHSAAASSPDSPHSTTSESGLEQLRRFPRGDAGHIRRRSHLSSGQARAAQESAVAALSRESSEVELVPTQLGSTSDIASEASSESHVRDQPDNFAVDSSTGAVATPLHAVTQTSQQLQHAPKNVGFSAAVPSDTADDVGSPDTQHNTQAAASAPKQEVAVDPETPPRADLRPTQLQASSLQSDSPSTVPDPSFSLSPARPRQPAPESAALDLSALRASLSPARKGSPAQQDHSTGTQQLSTMPSMSSVELPAEPSSEAQGVDLAEVEFMLQLIRAWLPFKLPEHGNEGAQLVAACQDGILLR